MPARARCHHLFRLALLPLCAHAATCWAGMLAATRWKRRRLSSMEFAQPVLYRHSKAAVAGAGVLLTLFSRRAADGRCDGVKRCRRTAHSASLLPLQRGAATCHRRYRRGTVGVVCAIGGVGDLARSRTGGIRQRAVAGVSILRVLHSRARCAASGATWRARVCASGRYTLPVGGTAQAARTVASFLFGGGGASAERTGTGVPHHLLHGEQRLGIKNSLYHYAPSYQHIHASRTLIFSTGTCLLLLRHNPLTLSGIFPRIRVCCYCAVAAVWQRWFALPRRKKTFVPPGCRQTGGVSMWWADDRRGRRYNLERRRWINGDGGQHAALLRGRLYTCGFGASS